MIPALFRQQLLWKDTAIHLRLIHVWAMFLIFTGAYYGAISYFRRGCCRKLEVLSIKWRRFQRRWSANSTRWATSMLVRHILLLTVRLQLCRMSSGDGYGGLKGRLGVGSQLGRRSWTSFLQKVYSSVNIVKIICFVQLWLHGGNSTSRLVWLCMGATSLARTGVSLIHLGGGRGGRAPHCESHMVKEWMDTGLSMEFA